MKKFKKFKILKSKKYFSAGRVGVSKFLNNFIFVLILFQIRDALDLTYNRSGTRIWGEPHENKFAPEISQKKN